MGAVASFFSHWYWHGIYTIPPPCLFNHTFRKYFSDSSFGGPLACTRVARWGTEWGDRNRGPIMFYAFWLSLAAFALYGIGFASLSTTAQHIRDAAWAVATVDETNKKIGLKITGDFYFGLRAFVSDCKESGGFHLCQDSNVEKWDEADCNEDFCEPCHNASDQTISTAFFSVFTMIPQILTNLQRSTRHGDLNCQKWVGISSAFFGTISTLIAILQYYRGCYLKIPDELSNGVAFPHRLGPAYYCMLVATLLKPYDLWANIIIPVPETGYWDPDSAKIAITSELDEEKQQNVSDASGGAMVHPVTEKKDVDDKKQPENDVEEGLVVQNISDRDSDGEGGSVVASSKGKATQKAIKAAAAREKEEASYGDSINGMIASHTKDIPLEALPSQAVARDVMIIDGKTISTVEYGGVAGQQ